MKPKKITKKLALNKNTVANIDKMQDVLAGGVDLPPATWGQLSCETGCNTLAYGDACPIHLIWKCADTNPPTR